MCVLNERFYGCTDEAEAVLESISGFKGKGEQAGKMISPDRLLKQRNRVD